MADWPIIDEFLQREDVTYTIWFIGGGECSEAKVRDLVDGAMEVFQNESVGIVTGGTDDGLPAIAAESAKEHGLPTLGILPERATKFRLEAYNDYLIYVPPRYGESRWGDESEIGAKLTDGVIMIGGGVGTEAEYALSQKEAPIPIVAIDGTGGLSDRLNREPDYQESDTTPSKPISEGKSAAEFILMKIN
jgi:predicted Rossmann-fold nucleotide-binding protein